MTSEKKATAQPPGGTERGLKGGSFDSSDPESGAQPARVPASRPWWLLLLPLCFLLHIAEELWAGEGFVAWTGRLFSSPITATRYATINVIGWSVFAAFTVLAILSSRLVWLAATLATMLLVNAGLHALGTLVTTAYSPGLVTSLLLYPPVSLLALRYTRHAVPSGMLGAAIGAGVFLHVLVLVAAFG